MHKLVIKDNLPRFNTTINEAKRSWKAYANSKKTHTNLVWALCKNQLRGVKLQKGASFVTLWYLPNKNYDPDNSYFANKYIFDGLVQAGVLQDDRYEDVSGGVLALPYIDKDNPRVEIYIFENPFVLHDMFGGLLKKAIEIEKQLKKDGLKK